jgi:hypothetical protein
MSCNFSTVSSFSYNIHLWKTFISYIIYLSFYLATSNKKQLTWSADTFWEFINPSHGRFWWKWSNFEIKIKTSSPALEWKWTHYLHVKSPI